MSQQFKTQADIWQALLNQQKITHIFWKTEGLYAYLKDGFVCSSIGEKLSNNFQNYDEWCIYEPPKPKKILKPFIVDVDESITIRFFENEIKAKEFVKKYDLKYLGPAKGIPDQEVEEV